MPEYDLETLVRAVRPEPLPAWTARMDREVANRFPNASPPAWLWPFALLRANWAPLTGVATLVLIVVLAATQIHVSGSSDKLASGGASSNSSDSAESSPAVKQASGSASAAPPSAVYTPDSRAVVRDVTLTLSTAPADVERVSDRVIGVADTLGGYVQDSSVTARQSAEITLRVPQDKLQQALAQLSRLGHVSSRTQESQDVTDQRDQLDAAVRDARAYRDSLRTRLANAKTDREAASLRGRLQRAEQALRSRQRDVARLSQQTSMATIDVKVRGDRRSAAAPVKPGGRWTPGDALHDAGRVLEVVAGVLLIGLAVALPLAVIAGAAALVSQLLKRRRRERALELA
jgi:hypothetical protein